MVEKQEEEMKVVAVKAAMVKEIREKSRDPRKMPQAVVERPILKTADQK